MESYIFSGNKRKQQRKRFDKYVSIFTALFFATKWKRREEANIYCDKQSIIPIDLKLLYMLLMVFSCDNAVSTTNNALNRSTFKQGGLYINI